MLNTHDIETLRERGCTNLQILELMARVVPSAKKALEDAKADTTVPVSVKDSIVGKMLDEETPAIAPSGLPYMRSWGLRDGGCTYEPEQIQTNEVFEENPAFDWSLTLPYIGIGAVIIINMLVAWSIMKNRRGQLWSMWTRRIIVLLGVSLCFIHPVIGIAVGGVSIWSLIDD